MILSRRKLGQLLLGAVGARSLFLKRAFAEAASFDIDRLRDQHPYQTVIDQSGTYRADAVILLLGLPVFSRTGVGSGFVSFRQAKRSGVDMTTLRFAGGSFPQRAHNLNRLGFIEEVTIATETGPVEAAYFGFMTASPEEAITEAKHSLDSKPGDVPYVAAEGHISSTNFRSAKTHFLFPSQFTWADRSSLLRQVRSQFHTSDLTVKDVPFGGQKWPGTLLQSIAQAVQQNVVNFETDYVYNAKQFHLKLDKTADPKTGAAFQAKGLTPNPQAVAMYRGLIHDRLTGKQTKFKFWMDGQRANSLPLRIDLQPRSFLSLSFEFDPTLKSDKESLDI